MVGFATDTRILAMCDRVRRKGSTAILIWGSGKLVHHEQCAILIIMIHAVPPNGERRDISANGTPPGWSLEAKSHRGLIVLIDI